VDSPVKPAPITIASVSAVPTSCGRSGAGGVTATHNEGGQRTSALSIIDLPFGAGGCRVVEAAAL